MSGCGSTGKKGVRRATRTAHIDGSWISRSLRSQHVDTDPLDIQTGGKKKSQFKTR